MAVWYYLSFADAKRPKGQQFLGGCYIEVPPDVQGDTRLMLWAALRRTHEIGINPGGDVRAHGPIPEAFIWDHVPPAMREKLLTREQLAQT